MSDAATFLHEFANRPHNALAPDWFTIGEEANPEVMRRIAESVSSLPLELQVRSAPMLAHWFLLDSMLLANRANRDGMHANALALTRQCVEAISIIELGICGHHEAEAKLLKWESDKLTPGSLRAWLGSSVWPRYGAGLWTEPWSTFMREFAAAVQPYAHYGRNLAQWQSRLHRFNPKDDRHMVIEMTPRAYDPQKATRITLFHMILTFTLGRIWIAANSDDGDFTALVKRLGVALSKSRYLDGHKTDWSEQFWAMVWERGGGTILE
ncbi:hypothetical protein [Inquilinus sp. OTU3971]|uniref:hypothetical protein n=1 Tax=Inquilinus sp. OTU3971 TaxID=3043855 RepID=UPI00313B9B0D